MFITWRQEWIAPYESVWSILEKAKQVNRVTTRQLMSYLGYALPTCDLINFGKGNQHVKNTFGVCLYAHTQRSLEEIMGFLPKHMERSYLLREELHYCNECIKYGHHSLLHQIKIFNTCPYHKSPLNNTCQSCGLSILLFTAGNNDVDGFICKCNEYIINEKTIHFTSWKFNYDIINSDVKAWINLSVLQKNRLAQTFITNNYIFDNKNIFNMLLSVSSGTNHSAITSASISKLTSIILDVDATEVVNHLENNRFLKWNYSNYEKLHDDIYESIRKTVKCVEKYILKNIMIIHQKCIENVMQNKGNKGCRYGGTCVYALAYINWKKCLLDIDLNQREVGPTRKSKLKKFDVLVQLFTKEIYNLLEFAINSLYQKKPQNTAALKWILNHFIASIALNYYFDVFNYFRSNIKKIKSSNRINVPKEELSVPCVFFYVPNSIDEHIEFYWFRATSYTKKNNNNSSSYCDWLQ